MTKEDWQKAEEALKSFFGYVKLNVDGYEVSFSLRRVSAYKNEIVIYVNGVFKGEWLCNECEERRRFLRKSERRIFSEKKIKEMGLKGKIAKEAREEKFTFYHNTWLSFGALKRHLVANNEKIEIIEIK